MREPILLHGKKLMGVRKYLWEGKWATRRCLINNQATSSLFGSCALCWQKQGGGSDGRTQLSVGDTMEQAEKPPL